MKQSHELLRRLGDVEGALDHLLGDEVLVEGLPLAADNQHPTLGLEVVSGRCQGREVGGDCRVSRLLKRESLCERRLMYRLSLCYLREE